MAEREKSMFGLRVDDWVGILTIVSLATGAMSFLIGSIVTQKMKPISEQVTQLMTCLENLNETLKNHSHKFDYLEEHVKQHDIDIALLKEGVNHDEKN